uniref:Glycosyltransferase family 92 protein n=1 Tax=Globodera rostochiensis TaxID=31243 RepID=A0A914H763_GLORO
MQFSFILNILAVVFSIWCSYERLKKVLPTLTNQLGGTTVVIMETMKPITRDVIIYATFLYKNSTSFGTTGHDTFVMLMLAYRTDNFPFMRCARENIETEPVTAQLQSYDYTALCNQAIFIAICNFPTDLANDRRQNEGAMIDLGPQVLVNEQLRQTYADEPIFHELVVRKADQTPRNLLICVSRIFAFEKWQLLLTAMEVYKALGVDLVVMHIVSALSAVIKLINAYEAEGRLAVRKGFKLPILRAMNFDPELQIEYSGQLRWRMNAFMSFEKVPNLSHFWIWMICCGILLTRRQKNESTKASARNFMHKFRELILSKQMYNSEKLVLRPARIDAFWVHFTRDYKGKHKPVQLSNDYMTILHLSKDIKASAAEGYNEKFLTKIMNWPAAVNESDFLKKATTKKIIDQMPKKHYYFDAIRHCSRFINNYPNAPVQIPSPCLSYKLCNLPKVKVDCSVAKSKYYTKTIMPTNIYRVHVLRKSYFVKRKGGCFGRKLKF